MDIFEQSQTVDPEVRAYVTSLVNAVGGSSTYDDSYAVGDDAVAVLKDLQRWLRLYDEKTNRLDVKRCLAEANLVKGDLLEILAQWSDGDESKLKNRLALACLELLVPLSWPIALDVEKATVNHHRHVPYLQLAQVGYKRAILHHEYTKILRSAIRVGLPAIAEPKRERTRRNEGIIKLVLYFFRNIAMITQPQHLPSQGDENEVSRSSTIDQFHAQDVFSLLLTIGSSDEFQDQDVILMEILFHLVKGVDARKLFMEKDQVSKTETDELRDLMRKERAMLDSYKQHAPTRHNRFGTMVWVKREEKTSTVSGQHTVCDENSTLRQMDASKKWNRPQYRGKLAQESNESSGFGMRVDLTDSARRHLRQFVEDFLDSSFNPLFSSLRKAIEREAVRVQDTMHPRQYFYLISWFLEAEAARRDRSQQTTTSAPRSSDQHGSGDNTFAYIAAVLDQETFVLLNRRMQTAFDGKEWQDLQATLLCFTRILTTVQNMSESKDEEDQEIAENIQNRIFYEEATHDRIVQILRGYAHQGFAYLDAVTECVHVFVRLLERYSKQNVDLQIRSKRRARRRQKPKDVGQQGDGGQSDDENDEQEAYRAVSERKFDFARFSAKFLTQPCVSTFISMLHYYRELSSAQLKRCHRFLYRLAFKHDLAIVLFRVDVLALLHRLVKGPEGLDPKGEGFKEWETLVQQVFRRCIKWIERPTEGEGWRGAAMVEMLFSKIPGTMFYMQNGYDKMVETRPPRPPAELEVKASVAAKQKIAVAVSLLIEQAKSDAIVWAKSVLSTAISEREAWQAANDATRSDANEQDPPMPPSIFLTPDTPERKTALFRDKHLRLLLETLGFQRLGLAQDVDAAWIIPPELSAAQLSESLDQLSKAEFDPSSFADGKSAADLVRPTATGRAGAVFEETDSEGAAEDESMFPPNLRQPRKRNGSEGDDPPRKRQRKNHVEATEEELQARAEARRQREKEKNAKIKSALFVTASDDESDAEGDAEFFRQEAEKRKKMDGIIRATLMKERTQGEKRVNQKAGKKTKRKTTDLDDDEDATDIDEHTNGTVQISSGEGAASSSDEEDNHPAVDVTLPASSSPREDSGMAGVDSDVEQIDVAPSSKAPPRRSRAVFLEDSDDD